MPRTFEPPQSIFPIAYLPLTDLQLALDPPFASFPKGHLSLVVLGHDFHELPGQNCMLEERERGRRQRCEYREGTHEDKQRRVLTWVFWILKSTEALLTASSLGMLCSMAAGGQFHVRPEEHTNASRQDALTHTSVWSEPHWNSLWYRWSGCPAALLCLQRWYKEKSSEWQLNITNETKAGHGYTTLRETLALMDQTQRRPNRWERSYYYYYYDNYAIFA